MLKIFNNLVPFFHDNYRRINIREYARLQRISPPSASKLLFQFEKEGLLKKEVDRRYIYFVANRENKVFVDLLRVYWYLTLKKAGLVEHLEREFVQPLIVLFGSLSKAEATQESDIDIAVFSASRKKVDLVPFERRIKRTIQILTFPRSEDVKNKELLKNIMNGFIISGGW
ncbi:nucleotidyltransferase domain-containing protein [Candidatus Woesearchaeota archaeon]|nr:nucleotidyltransferase domain-containing protein [Candidatus Woesearchaeota archaeon]